MSAQPSRFASIEGLLSAAPPASTETPKPQPIRQVKEEEEAPSAPAVTEPDQKPEPMRQRTAATSKQTGGTRRVAFRLSPDLKARLVDRSTRDQCSQVDVVKSAIEHAEASDAFTGAFDEPPTGGLFKRSQRAVATPTVPSEIRLTLAERDLVDKLAVQHGAKDRTALIVKALQLHLK